MKKIIKIFTATITLVSVLIFSLVVYGNISFSDEAYVSDGVIYLSGLFSVSNKRSNVSAAARVSDESVIKRDVKLLGTIPVKTIEHSESDRKYLMPGGGLIGIRLKTDGVLVVGTEYFESSVGSISPAIEAGIAVGDTLKTVEDVKITSNDQLSEIISASGGDELEFEIIRDGQTVELTLTPEISTLTGEYKCGLWIRDSTGGIGTLTYCDIESGGFGSLGHGIYDADTGKIIPTEKGEICSATLNGVNKGTNGTAGELRGVISGEAYGSILTNNENGIYGYIDYIENPAEILPVAFPYEVSTGEAEIISTIRNNEKEHFSIEIEKINETSDNKNFIIRITDEELLEITGGIVQGMSGSPIIQNGRIVGAVTHVFVNNPTKGYGIYIENMLESAE